MALRKHIRHHTILGVLGGSGSGSTGNVRFWAYQDFASILTTNQTITKNDNATISYSPSNNTIVSNSAVITDQNNKAVYNGTTRLFSSRVFVSSNTNQSVTLNLVPNVTWAPFRIWYLIESINQPFGRIEAPKFVTKQRLEMLNATYVDQTGDTMYGNLDMNNNQIQNLLDPTTATEPLRYGNDNELYFYDTSRSKKLGTSVLHISAGRNNPSASNQYLRISDGAPMNLNGFVLPYDATLIGISMSGRDNNETWTAEIRRNGSVTVLSSLQIVNAYQNYDFTKNVNFDAGDRVMIYLNGTTISYPFVTAYFRRRI